MGQDYDGAFWHHEGPASTSVQRAADSAYRAQGSICDLWTDLPNSVCELIREKYNVLEKRLADLISDLREYDRNLCDVCGHWRDEPEHRAYCEASESPDEYDIIRDALLAGAVVAGAPLPAPGPEDQ